MKVQTCKLLKNAKYESMKCDTKKSFITDLEEEWQNALPSAWVFLELALVVTMFASCPHRHLIETSNCEQQS